MERISIPILATDIGYGDTKYGYELGGKFKTSKFPTAIAETEAGDRNIFGEDEGTIEDAIEPYLLANGYIERTARGRVATLKSHEAINTTN